jgi:hypothetical protein
MKKFKIGFQWSSSSWRLGSGYFLPFYCSSLPALRVTQLTLLQSNGVHESWRCGYNRHNISFIEAQRVAAIDLPEWVSSKPLLWSRGSISAFSLLFQAELSLYKPHGSGFPAVCCPARLWRRRSIAKARIFFIFSSPCVPSFLHGAMSGLSTAASIWGEHHLDLSWW